MDSIPNRSERAASHAANKAQPNQIQLATAVNANFRYVSPNIRKRGSGKWGANNKQ